MPHAMPCWPQPQSGLTRALNGVALYGGYAVTDAETRYSMRWAFGGVKIVAEPGEGGVLSPDGPAGGPLSGTRRVITVVLSGGKDDAETFAARLVS